MRIVHSPSSPLLVDLRGAAKILGVAPSSVRKLVLRKQLPATRAGRGGKIFIPQGALAAYVATLAKEARTAG